MIRHDIAIGDTLEYLNTKTSYEVIGFERRRDHLFYVIAQTQDSKCWDLGSIADVMWAIVDEKIKLIKKNA